MKRDIIVIGTSAGGIEVLPKVLGDLPEGFPAAIFIVVHLSPCSPGLLPQILSRAGTLPAAHAKNGEVFRPGRIYVAPPDYHLLLSPEAIRVSRGPRENRHRPAIDPLFRSAAYSFGERVIGVVLTGALDDGALGLQIIKEQGGTAVVQDPRDAVFPSMPEAALRYADVDHILPADQIGGALIKLTVGAGLQLSAPAAAGNGKNDKFVDRAMTRKEREQQIGPPSSFICPDCNGPLWELKDRKFKHYQCLVGHAYSPENLLEAEGEALERALWVAVKTLEERAALLRHLANDVKRSQRPLTSANFEARAGECEENAKVIREMLRKGSIKRPSSNGPKRSQGRTQKPRGKK